MGVENANTKLCTSFWRTSKMIATWSSKNLFHNLLLRMQRASTTLILSQNNKACNVTNELVKIFVSLHCVTPSFSMSNANNRRPLKCTKYLQPKSHIAHVVFWALLLKEANTILILFWTELGQAENFLIAPRIYVFLSICLAISACFLVLSYTSSTFVVNKRQRHCASRIARFISNNSASYLLSHGTVDARTENCMLFYVTENVVAEDELIERDT